MLTHNTNVPCTNPPGASVISVDSLNVPASVPAMAVNVGDSAGGGGGWKTATTSTLAKHTDGQGWKVAASSVDGLEDFDADREDDNRDENETEEEAIVNKAAVQGTGPRSRVVTVASSTSAPMSNGQSIDRAQSNAQSNDGLSDTPDDHDLREISVVPTTHELTSQSISHSMDSIVIGLAAQSNIQSNDRAQSNAQSNAQSLDSIVLPGLPVMDDDVVMTATADPTATITVTGATTGASAVVGTDTTKLSSSAIAVTASSTGGSRNDTGGDAEENMKTEPLAVAADVEDDDDDDPFDLSGSSMRFTGKWPLHTPSLVLYTLNKLILS